MNKLITILANMELYKGQNMLQNPIYSNYRPAFYFKGAPTRISGKIDLIDYEHLQPGSSAIVRVTFNKGILADNYFVAGNSFEISEGGQYTLGNGKVLELLEI